MPSAALLVVDMLNPYDHEDADVLAGNADAVACIDTELGDAALRMMERNMRAQVVEASCCLDDLR